MPVYDMQRQAPEHSSCLDLFNVSSRCSHLIMGTAVSAKSGLLNLQSVPRPPEVLSKNTSRGDLEMCQREGFSLHWHGACSYQLSNLWQLTLS